MRCFESFSVEEPDICFILSRRMWISRKAGSGIVEDQRCSCADWFLSSAAWSRSRQELQGCRFCRFLCLPRQEVFCGTRFSSMPDGSRVIPGRKFQRPSARMQICFSWWPGSPSRLQFCSADAGREESRRSHIESHCGWEQAGKRRVKRRENSFYKIIELFE